MLENKLKEIIINKYGSIRQFSLKINIPYTTVDSILKRGIDNSNVGNVIKICKALNISIDNLLDNKEISEVNTIDVNTSSINNKNNFIEQYQVLFDKDDCLTPEEKSFMINYLETKHKEIDKEMDKKE